MQRWRMEDLDAPDVGEQRIVDPMERIGIAVVGAVLLVVAAGALADRVHTAARDASTAPDASTASVARNAVRVSQLSDAAPMVTWRTMAGAGDRPCGDPQITYVERVVVLTDDFAGNESSRTCVIYVGYPLEPRDSHRRR
jgi:hypothetical protein